MSRSVFDVPSDETFFDQVILVMLDLPSGYIFVEQKTENYQDETWQQRVNLALKSLSFKIRDPDNNPV